MTCWHMFSAMAVSKPVYSSHGLSPRIVCLFEHGRRREDSDVFPVRRVHPEGQMVAKSSYHHRNNKSRLKRWAKKNDDDLL